jgi:Phosphotransferase enzyme family
VSRACCHDAGVVEDGAERSGDAEVPLAGGNMSAVARRGGAVHRSAGPWTPTVHRLLDHLRTRGVDWLPRPLGMDDQGREVLTFLPGTVPTYPMPAEVWTEEVLTTTGRWLALVHQAGADFDTTGATWQLPAHAPVEVVCLNDVAPYNMVFDDAGHVSGWIDVDVASPGPRVWDLAHLAHRLVPLTGAADTGAGAPDLPRCRRRLGLLCQAYAEAGDQVAIPPAEVLRVAVTRLEDLADFTAARAAAGADHVAPHVAGYRRDAAWVAAHARQLTSP